MQKGPLLVLGSYLFWGILPIYWKWLGAYDAVFILVNRMIWSFVLTFALLWINGRLGELRQALKQPRLLATLTAASALGALNWGSYIYAVKTDRVVDAGLAYYMYPILAILIGALIFRERLSMAQWCAVSFAAIGIVAPLCVAGQVPWLALVIGTSFSLYGAIKKSVQTPALVSLCIETGLMTLPALAVMGKMLSPGGVVAMPSIGMWCMLVTTGVVTAFPLVVYSRGVQTTPYSLVGVISFISPTMTLLIGLLLYRETMAPGLLMTFCFVWLGLGMYLFSVWRQSRRQQNHTEV